jgi:hypothetical protein
MKVGYYILVVPDWLKTMSAYSFFGLLIFIPIYSVSKSYKPGLIHFTSEYLLITDNPTKQLSIKSIKKIFLNDVKRWFKSPRQAAEVVITQTGNRKTSFLLKRYEESEGFIESLSKLENVEFGFYNEWSINTHDDD